ncbi:heme peroxidase, partial [Mycena sp. CBHHK59/15]
GRTAAAESCCIWFDVLDDIQLKLFNGGECGEEVHELTFHDAIGFSPALFFEGKFGQVRPTMESVSLNHIHERHPFMHCQRHIVDAQRPFTHAHKVSFGDFIQFSGAIGVGNRPGAPRLEFL